MGAGILGRKIGCNLGEGQISSFVTFAVTGAKMVTIHLGDNMNIPWFSLKAPYTDLD